MPFGKINNQDLFISSHIRTFLAVIFNLNFGKVRRITSLSNSYYIESYYQNIDLYNQAELSVVEYLCIFMKIVWLLHV